MSVAYSQALFSTRSSRKLGLLVSEINRYKFRVLRGWNISGRTLFSSPQNIQPATSTAKFRKPEPRSTRFFAVTCFFLLWNIFAYPPQRQQAFVLPLLLSRCSPAGQTPLRAAALKHHALNGEVIERFLHLHLQDIHKRRCTQDIRRIRRRRT